MAYQRCPVDGASRRSRWLFFQAKRHSRRPLFVPLGKGDYRGCGTNSPLPPTNPPGKVEKAEQYAGVFTSPDGSRIEFKAEGDRLLLLHQNQRLQVETAATPGLLVQHPDFDRFLFTFGREQGKNGEVTEVSHGANWFSSEKYVGPRSFSTPKEWDAFVGHYRISPLFGSLRIVSRKGKLWMDGTFPLEPLDADTFKRVDRQSNCDRIRFLDVVTGEAMRLKYSGRDYWRVMA